MNNPNHTTINLLLADDDEDDRWLFKHALTDLSIPHTLQVFSNGAELINYLLINQQQLPDAVFLDINMPKKDGLECLTEIKSHQNLKIIPVIIYSTANPGLKAKEMYANGAYHYIQKPGSFFTLRKILNKVLSLIRCPHHHPSVENFIITDEENIK
jgi:CheY-like chemotaxis protein